MSLEIVALSEKLFEPLRGVLDTVARERRFLAFTARLAEIELRS